MKNRIIKILIITVLSSTISITIADYSEAKTKKVIQSTKEGHNFNNIGGDVNITVKGISRKQYRDDLNDLEKELIEKHEKTIAALKTTHKADKRQSLEQNKIIQGKELQALRTKLASLEESYKELVENRQKQINDLNEYEYLFSKDVLREAQLALAKGDDSKARDIFIKIIQLAKVMDKQAAKASFNLGKMAEDKIDYYNAYKHYQEAVKRDGHNPEYLFNAGRLASTIALYDKAIDYYEKALDIKIKEKGLESIKVAVLWNNLGEAWDSKGYYDKAIGYYEKALANGLKTFGTDHPWVATYWNNLGSAWNNKGKYDKAIGYFEKALPSDLKTLGPDHPNVAINWNNLGSAWDSKGEHDKAIGYYEKALASDLKTFGTDHPQVAIYWNNLGEAWREKGNYNKAIGYYEKALASNLKTFGPDHPKVAIRWNNLGLAWYGKGQYNKAIKYYEKALKNFKLSLGDAHTYTLSMRSKIGFAKKKLANAN